MIDGNSGNVSVSVFINASGGNVRRDATRNKISTFFINTETKVSS